MIRIDEIIYKPYEGINTYQDLLKAVNAATPEISFLGLRYIKSSGFEGSVSLELLANKVINLSETHFNISEEERELGNNIGSRIIQLLRDSEEILKNKCFITKFFCYLRDVHFDILGGTESLQGRLDIAYFCLYTKEQWIEKFKTEPSGQPHRTNPERWFA